MVASLGEAFATIGVREVKDRYNVMFRPSDVRRIDDMARRCGVSRSEMLLFCFNLVEATVGDGIFGPGEALDDDCE